MVEISSVEERGIYQDLLRKFRDEGHCVTIISPVERRRKIPSNLKNENGVNILQVRTLNIQKTNIIEKGIGTLLIEWQFLRGVRRFLSDIKFDLVLYSTPPVTFANVISFVKKRDGAKSYLLLKDIFPQNAVDMNLMKKGSLIHRFFQKKEKQLYRISDRIGCMSPANVQFLLRHNSDLSSGKVEENPNTIEPISINYSDSEKQSIRKKYGIPADKTVFIYGGNLGKPQGLDFLLETISATNNSRAFFLIVGDGTEYSKVENWFKNHQPNNAALLNKLPKDDYDRLLASADVGLIFLHKDFLIPNFPSRLLSYLEMEMPVISATDPNTDIGDIIEEAACGFKVLAGNQQQMQQAIEKLLSSDLKKMGKNGRKLLEERYTVGKSYRLISDFMAE
ncbi:Glycosyltransferase involved in cell wall bisynthesis [Cruoricaptor ignavus]|uniref:Glycosyltransferase involved in cell wall bisynthesis n=1 Tax=Cruoricaptor ignavus TaxID=1118202 RepID=A0A1M6F2X4_9FLAO|nr:Glycosyltransferase involved in cell wall bisynthesis [Cruoricaptor ignavus]